MWLNPPKVDHTTKTYYKLYFLQLLKIFTMLKPKLRPGITNKSHYDSISHHGNTKCQKQYVSQWLLLLVWRFSESFRKHGGWWRASGLRAKSLQGKTWRHVIMLTPSFPGRRALISELWPSTIPQKSAIIVLSTQASMREGVVMTMKCGMKFRKGELKKFTDPKTIQQYYEA